MNAATVAGTLTGTVLALAGVCAFAVISVGVGSRLLRWAKLPEEEPGERLLCGAGLGVVVFELACMVLVAMGKVRPGIWVLLSAGSLVVVLERGELWKLFAELREKSRSSTRSAKVLRWVLFGVLLLEGVAAMAPLTGSDALEYHFPGAQWLVQNGFHPNFFSIHEFLIGQSHLLIVTGLALGSEKLALGLLYLGGALAALAGAHLAGRWMPEAGAWAAALAFVLSPVVFWQISTAGTPDVWMAFFTTLAVLQVARAAESGLGIHAALAGVFAGEIGGSKYTGCVVAASVGLALVAQRRSWSLVSWFTAGALSAGVWPYLRNWCWTGDPVFPLLMRRLHPENVNAQALASFLADTGASGQRSIFGLLRFPLFAAIDPRNVGFWQFFGPLCLCFAPLVFFAVRRTALWRTVLMVWVISALGIGMISGMARFVMPVYSLALAAVLTGVWAIPERGWWAVRATALATLAVFLAVGAAGLVFYERKALAAAVGLTSRASYLEAGRPEFEIVNFVNRTLQGREDQGKVMVFFRHMYGLQAPHVNGNPNLSWAIDPQKLRDDAAWRQLFQREGIHWVVMSGPYPGSIRGILEQMEVDGYLVPIAKEGIEDFTANRIQGKRDTLAVEILEVRR